MGRNEEMKSLRGLLAGRPIRALVLHGFGGHADEFIEMLWALPTDELIAVPADLDTAGRTPC